MLVGIVSDSHDNLPALEEALNLLRDAGAEAVLHAGDVVAPFAAKVLAGFPGEVLVVYGNNDGERDGLKKTLPQITDGPLVFELGGRKFMLVHDGSDAGPLEGVDYLVFGHTHEPFDGRMGGARALNPGECGGWLTGKRTAMLLDTQSGLVETLEF